jgi:hypothetical protein
LRLELRSRKEAFRWQHRIAGLNTGMPRPSKYLPIDGYFVRTPKPCRSRFEMRKAVFDRSNREPAPRMDLRLETPGRERAPINPRGTPLAQPGGARRCRDTSGEIEVHPQESGLEESVQCGKRFLWILLRKKMTGLDRFELHVHAFVPPSRLNVEERGRRG